MENMIINGELNQVRLVMEAARYREDEINEIIELLASLDNKKEPWNTARVSISC